MDYWQETIQSALDDVGLLATQHQIEQIADSIRIAHENYGMAHGYDCIPNPLETELERVNILLDEERSSVVCRSCNGRGRIFIQGPYHSSNSDCFECKGTGKIYEK